MDSATNNYTGEYTIYDDIDNTYKHYNVHGDLIYTDASNQCGYDTINPFNKVNDYKARDRVVSEEVKADLRSAHGIELGNPRTEKDRDNARVVEMLEKEFRNRVEKEFKEEIKKLQNKVEELTNCLSDTTRSKDGIALELHTTRSNWQAAMDHNAGLKSKCDDLNKESVILVADKVAAMAERDVAEEKLAHFIMPSHKEDERLLDLE